MSQIGTLFGLYQDPGQEAAKFTNQIPGQVEKYNQPYMDAGSQSLQSINPAVSQGIQNPGQFQNQMAQEYTQSPGYRFAMDQALQGANRSAASGGMAGSPMHSQQNMQLAADLASQDFGNWANRAQRGYESNLGAGMQMAGMGQRAGENQSGMVARSLGQQGQYAHDSASTHNMMMNAILGNLASAAGLPGFSGFTQQGGGQGSGQGMGQLVQMLMSSGMI